MEADATSSHSSRHIGHTFSEAVILSVRRFFFEGFSALKKNNCKLPAGFEPASGDSKSPVMNRYTMGAKILLIEFFFLF